MENDDKSVMERPGDVPFRVERSAAGSLSKQMTDGLRDAIVSGHYRPGEVLPTIVEWARLLGVSIRVPEAAVAALAKEGLITVQKGIGCVVNPRRQSVWNGRVLVVVPDGDHVYYQNALVGQVRARICEEGYMFAQVTVVRKGNGRYDFRQLAHELKSRPDFTLLVENRPEIERLLSKSGVPFGVFGKDRCTLSGCVANFRRSNNAVISDIVAHCEMAGVRRVLQVTKETGGYFDAVPLLRKHDIEAGEWQTPVVFECGRAEGTERGAFNAFRERFAKEGRGWLPELFVFTDDFVAAGALIAMLMEGLRIPEDVRVVSLANKGNGPVYPVSLTRVENDPERHGEMLADAMSRFLAGRKARDGEIAPEYIVGESFP
ncbi:MAG: LacI family DNA-binding transcriptional regulator [Kiritimatiellae bacterium]|nr:LacI family DNA-binding transcriptional regulator [Kiritimatiellia bacterium]